MTPRSKHSRGAALVLVLMVAAVFLILMGTLIDVLAIESQNAIESSDAEAALTAAYSGVDVMILNIEEFYANSVQNGNFPQTADCSFQSPGGGTVTASCHAQVKESWNGTGQNYYLIESEGTSNPFGSTDPNGPQVVSRTVEALVKEIPFGAYAMFSETERSNAGGSVWYSSGQSYGGPVYSGDGSMHVRYDSSKSQNPIFPDGFTSSRPPGSIDWYNVVTGQDVGPQTPDELASVYGTGGKPNFLNEQLPLPGMAQNLVVFSEAYYGDSTHTDPNDLPSGPPGVYVNKGDPSCGTTLCTGIYVQGDAQLDASSVASPNGDLTSGTQTWKFSPIPADANSIQNTVTVTIDFAAGTTKVLDGGSGLTTYNGVASGVSGNGVQGNGAVFVNGNLTINDGSTVHGQYTVAVPDPPMKGEAMTLGGSLTYASDPSSGPSQDELALWADKIWLDSGSSNVTIDGMILTGYANECTDTRKCGGYFANIHCKASACNGGGVGNLTLYGSIIENMRGKMGVVGPDGQIVGGYLKASTYDPRLGVTPPPYSPTTNLYSIVALQDHGTTSMFP